ncbi:hypothetical protein K7W42_21770 [Deinococcus sp. HMF7604]|uniref:hypothetical protein n=1 Tax=Deinococcus betulae TaxID=2873312 RepID=UPI001CCA3F74|nr:hypothetical protein [Deinococcus betulae]MBZ9753466.1 hypothetical protein [Deinococcus betulae]
MWLLPAQLPLATAQTWLAQALGYRVHDLQQEVQPTLDWTGLPVHVPPALPVTDLATGELVPPDRWLPAVADLLRPTLPAGWL